jgi:hypothetical protein
MPESDGVATGRGLKDAAGAEMFVPKGKKWWKVLKEDDLISLEPLSSLAYEPFNLPADEKVMHARSFKRKCKLPTAFARA